MLFGSTAGLVRFSYSYIVTDFQHPAIFLYRRMYEWILLVLPLLVTVPGRNSTFTCFQNTAESNIQLQNVAWLLNGSALENYGLDDIITEPGPGDSGTIHQPEFGEQPHHNPVSSNPSIWCDSVCRRGCPAIARYKSCRGMMQRSFSVTVPDP